VTNFKITIIITRDSEAEALDLATQVAEAVHTAVDPGAEIQVTEWRDGKLERIVPTAAKVQAYKDRR
jgi:hypothetical protein